MYSDEEVTTALDKLVRTSIRREYGRLGNRRTDLTFSDLQDAAAGVFIIQPNAPFYVTYLASQRLIKKIDTARSSVQNFIGVIEGTGRYVTPIENLSPLANARAALTALSSATSSRTSSLARVEDNPAYQRFESNTGRFLSESSKNIRQDGELARTPEEARALLGTSLSDLEDEHAEIIRLAGLLQGAINDYEQMNLPGSLSANVIENSRAVLDERYSELEGMTPQQRLGALRDVTLDVLAARSTVKGFGSITPPTLFFIIDGSSSVYADESHPATPASITSEYSAPFIITDSAYELRFLVEGDTLDIPIQGSFIANIQATLYGPFEVTSSNDDLRVVLDNYPSVGSSTNFDVSLTNGATQQIYNIVADFNTAFDPATNPIIAEPHFVRGKWGGEVNITLSGGADVLLTATNPSVDFTNLDGTGLAVKSGDRVIIRDILSPNDEYLLDVVTVTASTLDCGWEHPGMPSTPDNGVQVLVGEDYALRLRITNEANDNGFMGAVDYQFEAVRDRVAILIPETGPSTDQEQQDAANLLGMVPLMESRSRGTSAEDVASSVANSALNNTYAAGAATPRIQVEAVFDPFAYEGRGRTNPSNFTQVIASKFQSIGDVTAGGSPTFTVSGAESAGVQVGDVVVLRTSSTAADVGLFGTITFVDDTQIVATFLTPISSADTNVQVEVGPDLSSLGFEAVVVISGENGNGGTYEVTEVGDIPIELSINSALPFPSTTGNASVELTLAVGRNTVKFSSLDETLSTELEITDGATDSAYDRFFTSASPRQAVGTTIYLQLPEWPAGLEVGDTFERYATQFDAPDFTSVVAALEESSLLIELEDALPTNQADLVMDVNSPVPFARIRRHKYNNYTTLQDSLEDWLDTSEAQSRWFNTFRALLNPLAVNLNPTPSQVGTAKSRLQEMDSALEQLSSYLEAYETDPVEDVDVLLESFTEKGADRATDILLEARFSDFFGLDQDEVSYAGRVQKAIRGVNREDLPVRKTGRYDPTSIDNQLIASYEETDYEFSSNDIDDVEVDIPDGVSYPLT